MCALSTRVVLPVLLTVLLPHSYETRFRLYGEWRSSGYSKHAISAYCKAVATQETKRLMKRYIAAFGCPVTADAAS